MWRAFSPPAALGVLLNWWAVRRATGLRAQIFQWCTAPALSALLMGLVINLLFQVLRRAGLEALPAAPLALPAVRRRALPGRPPRLRASTCAACSACAETALQTSRSVL